MFVCPLLSTSDIPGRTSAMFRTNCPCRTRGRTVSNNQVICVALCNCTSSADSVLQIWGRVISVQSISMAPSFKAVSFTSLPRSTSVYVNYFYFWSVGFFFSSFPKLRTSGNMYVSLCFLKGFSLLDIKQSCICNGHPLHMFILNSFSPVRSVVKWRSRERCCGRMGHQRPTVD